MITIPVICKVNAKIEISSFNNLLAICMRFMMDQIKIYNYAKGLEKLTKSWNKKPILLKNYVHLIDICVFTSL